METLLIALQLHKTSHQFIHLYIMQLYNYGLHVYAKILGLQPHVFMQ